MPTDVPLAPPLFGFLGAEVAEDPPVGEAEGVGHGVADVGLWEKNVLGGFQFPSSIYDVRTEGGGGGSENTLIL